MKVEIGLKNHSGEVIYRVKGYPVTVRGVYLVAYHPTYRWDGIPAAPCKMWETADPVTGLFVSRNCATRTEALAVAGDRIDRMGGAEGFRKEQEARLAAYAAHSAEEVAHTVPQA